MEIKNLTLNQEWSLSTRILFRFLFAYIFLYCFAFPFYFIPGAHAVIHPIGSLLQDLAIWVGSHVLGIDQSIPTQETGSGDTLIYWLIWITKFLLAILVTIIWSSIDYKRKSYPWLKKLLITYTRYYVALIILSYGLFKIVPVQFSEPSQSILLQTYGESSPMRLLWTFMGYSTTYQIFGGVAEAIGAVFLLFRRTTLLGALILVGVLTNVVLMNYCFDVPVKLASTHYLIFSIGLVAIYSRPLIQLFFLNQSTNPMEQSPLFEKRKLRLAAVIIKIALIGFAVYPQLTVAITYLQENETTTEPNSMTGVYDVYDYRNSNYADTLDSNYTEYWHRMVITNGYNSNILKVNKVSGEKLKYQIKIDTIDRKLTGHLAADSTQQLRLNYRTMPNGDLHWKGSLNADSLWLKTKEFETDSMMLMTRGFRWVSPVPYNR
ncbi:MAG: hypothetical protein HRU41_26775 [Saprospiraceae bacterium]|nr:hypothetical protein [Saprospiraceae bacterium]